MPSEKKLADGIGAQDHLGDRPGQWGWCGHAADLLGQAQPPPPGLPDRRHRLGQLRRHADAVRVGVEYRRVAVGVGERLRDRSFGQAGGLGQNRLGGVDVEIAVVSGAEDGPHVKHLEQVELEIADVGDVVAHCCSLHSKSAVAVSPYGGNVRNRNLRCGRTGPPACRYGPVKAGSACLVPEANSLT